MGRPVKANHRHSKLRPLYSRVKCTLEPVKRTLKLYHCLTSFCAVSSASRAAATCAKQGRFRRTICIALQA